MTSLDEKQKFLQQISEADEIWFIPTAKNRITRAELGLTVLDCERIVKNLNLEDYHRGPLDDHDQLKEGKVWIFKTNHENEVLYIKLKEIEIIQNDKIMKCLSCHIDNMEV